MSHIAFIGGTVD